MDDFVEVLERYFNRLANGDIPAKNKPPAECHGLLQACLSHIKSTDLDFTAMCQQRDSARVEIGLWKKYAEHLRGCSCEDYQDCGRVFYRHDWECSCGLRELQTKENNREG